MENFLAEKRDWVFSADSVRLNIFVAISKPYQESSFLSSE